MDKKVSIILSTYNEALEIKETINKIAEFIPNAEIIVVDDNSTDGTKDVINKIKSKNIFQIISK